MAITTCSPACHSPSFGRSDLYQSFCRRIRNSLRGPHYCSHHSHRSRDPFEWNPVSHKQSEKRMRKRVKAWVSDIHPYQCAIRSLRPVRHAIPIPHCAFEWLVGPVADAGATATTTLTACKDPKEYALHMVFGTPTAAPVVIILLHSEGVS